MASLLTGLPVLVKLCQDICGQLGTPSQVDSLLFSGKNILIKSFLTFGDCYIPDAFNIFPNYIEEDTEVLVGRRETEMASEVQEEVPVHEEFFLCGGVETQILKCGPWTNLFDTQSVAKPKLLIFIIPGNPGFSPFYLPFAKTLYSLMKGSFPVWVISYAGFSLVPKDKKILTAPNESNAQEIEDIYGLNGQIEHKIAFLRAHVPKDVKIILIGHSIGSYLSLQVMKRAPELPEKKGSLRGLSISRGGAGKRTPYCANGNRVTFFRQKTLDQKVIHTFLLFPTIERMSETPNGSSYCVWSDVVCCGQGYHDKWKSPEVANDESVLDKRDFGT
ncbi:hypothetical protein STEG23_011317 [Scotinomys teguina]